MTSRLVDQVSFPRTPDGRRMFRMSGMKKPELWRNVVLIAKSAHEHLAGEDLANTHAACAYCTLCNRDIPYKPGQTSAIGRHVEKWHSGSNKRTKSKRRRRGSPTASTDSSDTASDATPSPESSGVSKPTKEDEKRLKVLLAMWLATSLRPYSVVEDPGFREVMKFVATELGGVDIEIPGRLTVSREVKVQARRLRASLKAIISKTCDYYSLTTDAWTDRSMRGFIALTLHYVDPAFSMKSWVLEVESFTGKHTAEAIQGKLESALKRWGLAKDKCVKLLRDGASNAIKGAKLLGVSHMSCVAHSLHLVVGGGLIRKKGELTDEAVLAALDAEREAERLAREEQEAQEARATIAVVDAQSPATASNGQQSGTRPTAAAVRAAERTVLAEGGASEADDTSSAVPTPSPIDGNMAVHWNTVREQACDEVDKHTQASLGPEEQSALAYTRDIVQIFRSLSVYFRKSSKARYRFLELRKVHQPTVDFYLSLDCPTRWNSTLKMLLRFSSLKPTVTAFFDYLDSEEGISEFGRLGLRRPTLEYWFVLRCLLVLLLPFAAVTDELSGSDYPTLASAFPALRHIKSVLVRRDAFDTEAEKVEGYIFAERALTRMHEVRQTFLVLFLKRFSSMPHELMWISYLDPRFTDMQHLRPEEVIQAQEWLIEAAVEVGNITAEPVPIVMPVSPPRSSKHLSTPDKARANARTGMYGRRALEATQVVPPDSGDIRADCVVEFQAYLAEGSKVPLDQNPLDWWKLHHNTYPRIAKLARRWLGCVATSVPSERAFSTSGRIISVHRCSLKEDLVRDTVFLATNWKA